MTPASDSDLEQMQARARQRVVRVLREAFFDETKLPPTTPTIARLNPFIGVVVAHPLPESLGGIQQEISLGGYLLSTQEFWFQSGPWLDIIVDLAAGRGVTNALAQFIEHLYRRSDLSNRRWQERDPRGTLRDSLTHAGSALREHARVVSQEGERILLEHRARLGRAIERMASGETLDRKEPDDDLARRLAALREEYPGLSAEKEEAVLLFEAHVLHLWARLPQVGGYGQRVLHKKKARYIPMGNKPLERDPQALALQLLEDALFYRSRGTRKGDLAPLFSAQPMSSRSGMALGYIFALTDDFLPGDGKGDQHRAQRTNGQQAGAKAVPQGKEQDPSMSAVLRRVGKQVGPFVQHLFDQEFIVQLSSVRGLPAKAPADAYIKRLCTPVLGTKPERVTRMGERPAAGAALVQARNGPRAYTTCILPAYEAAFEVELPTGTSIIKWSQLELVLTQLQIASHAARAAFRDDMNVLAHLFSHELGRRLDEIAPGRVDEFLSGHHQGDQVLAWARSAAERIQCLHGFTELARCLFKSGREGALPRTWLRSDCLDWPKSHVPFDAAGWVAEIRQHLEDMGVEGRDSGWYQADWTCEVNGNRVDIQGKRVKRLAPFLDWDFTMPSTQAPRIFVLAPILEMAANAIAHLRGQRDRIQSPRLQIEIAAAREVIVVCIGNTYAATPPPHLTPIRLSSALRRFEAFDGPRSVDRRDGMFRLGFTVDLRKLRFSDHPIEGRDHG